jgi:hypothetical protein
MAWSQPNAALLGAARLPALPVPAAVQLDAAPPCPSVHACPLVIARIRSPACFDDATQSHALLLGRLARSLPCRFIR